MKLFASMSLFFIAGSLFAENGDTTSNRLKRNSAYVELGGNTLVYGFHYERVLFSSQKVAFASSIGYGFSYGNLGVFNQTVIPVELKLYSRPNKKNHLEFGLGYTYYYEKDKAPDLVNGVLVESSKHSGRPLLRLGYRYTATKGFLFRIALTPIYLKNAEPIELWPFWGGVSFGYTFK